MKTIKTTTLLLTGSMILILFFCSQEYNPFGDFTNAKTTVIHTSIKIRDTIEIFSTETLTAIVLVKELVDSVTIRTNGNRLWVGADSTLYSSEFTKEPFAFFFSYFDTGLKKITLATFKKNGQVDSDSFLLFVTSPIRQTDVTGSFGDSIRLFSPAVRDRDVDYIWSFGAGARFVSRSCSATVLLYSALLSGKGGVWVSDGRNASRADSFAFLLSDTAGPSIVCVNENFVGKDTIVTGDSVFNFKVRIVNRGDLWTDSASVDGKRFDRIDNKIYYRLIDKMYQYGLGNPKNMEVYALSHFENGVARTKNFTLLFSPDIRSALPVEIKVFTPSRDSTITLLTHYTISGIIENHSFDSLAARLYAYVNDIQEPAVLTVKGGLSGAWEWNIELIPGINSVSLQAKDIATLSALHQVDFTLFYADTAHDSTSPRILSITANGLPVNNFFTERAAVTLGVKAFDEISGIDTLTINGNYCKTPTSDNWYFDSIPLQHGKSGNEVVIHARDRKNNDTTAVVVLYRNQLPAIKKFPASAYLAIESVYAETIDAIDPDNDTITYEKASGPAGLIISPQGRIAWRPSLRDTGNHSITVRLWDGYQPMFRTFSLYVFGNQGHPGPIDFAVTVEDFPSFLEGGKDTLRIPLRVAKASGVRPFLFSARVVNKGKIILPEGSDSVLLWAPAASDTGFMQLMITVKDAFPSSDTLYPRVLIIPPNRPCSLSVKFSGDTTASGAIDLNKKRQKDTLVFTLHDPDNPLIERHTVTLHETRTQLSNIIDSAVVDSFSLVVDPLAFDGYDTIIAIIRDRLGTSDTIKQKLYFGMPPFTPQAIYPLNLMPIQGTSVTLTWQDVDPDNDELFYDVYFGSLPDELTRLAQTTEASFAISELLPQRTYYWRIVAHDWKSFTEGPLMQFTTR